MAVVLPGSFIFLAHMYTGSSAVAQALKKVPGTIVAYNKAKGIGHHATLDQVKQVCGDKLTGTEKVFTFIRHPYEVLLDMWLTNRNHLHTRLLERDLKREPTFKEFLQNWYELNMMPYMHEHRLFYHKAQIHLRYERLQVDLDTLFRRLPGTPSSLKVNLQGYELERDHYTTFYDDPTYKLVNELFRDDIAKFGYCFIWTNKASV